MPYVEIIDPLAANNRYFVNFGRSLASAGTTDTSAPVSIRNLVLGSLMNNQLVVWPHRSLCHTIGRLVFLFINIRKMTWMFILEHLYRIGN
ncbi:unnamed protein product, partial [Nesidiocoris tenuis]